jgi:hydrogenase maturation protease
MKGNGSMLVAGLGNVLMGDDAAGPYAVQLLLSRYEFAEDISVVDLGTPGLSLTPYLTGHDRLILIDTVHTTGEPGDVRLYRKRDLLRAPLHTRVSPHDPGVFEALNVLDLADAGPSEVLLVGIIPGPCELGMGLSPAVRGGVDRALEEVLRELTYAGARWTLRDEEVPADLWWEEP